MLVWTQTIPGIEEPRARKPTILELEPRAWVVIGFFPLLLCASYNLLLVYRTAPVVSIFGILLMTWISKRLTILLKDQIVFDLEPAVTLAAFWLIGPFWTVILTFGTTLWYSFAVLNRKTVWAYLFNIEQCLIAVSGAGILYALLVGDTGPFFSILAASLFLITVNALLTCAYFAAVDGKPLTQVWQQNECTLLCASFWIMATVGYVLARIFLFSPVFVLLLLPPLFLLYVASRSIFEVKEQVEVALAAIGDILEERDDYTFGHTLRVANYTKAIAQEMELKPDVTDICVKVARLHDIGKIAVTDVVLKKEGALSPEEYAHIQKHVRMIPELFPHMDRFGKLLHIAMYHHERFDGKGYPCGVAGYDIPLEARVVAVADAWDAMTSKRIYRAGLSEQEALKILQDHAGRQWDPAVVNAFMRAYDKGAFSTASRRIA